MSKQPRALRLADPGEVEEALTYEYAKTDDWIEAAATELRRMHALIEEMRNALKKINDGLYCDDYGNWRLPNSFDAQQLDEVISKSEPQS